MVVLAACGGGSGGGAAGALPIPPVATSPARMWGVTTDNPAIDTEAQVDALRSLARRVTVRTTFDPENSPADYRSAVVAMSRVADVMAQPLDSSAMVGVSLAQARTRIDQFLGALGDAVKVWEIGNELNGDWLGADPVLKAQAMFDAVKRAGGQTALTLYYEKPPAAGSDMIAWVDREIPDGHRMRSGLDYVFVSYYEDQNGGRELTQAELDAMFGALARRFPNARLGFGEFGWGGRIPASNAQRAELIRRFYNYRVPSVASYVGGGFYWHFRQTMTPKTQPDWLVLNGLLAAN
jgi:hypothetical protein